MRVLISGGGTGGHIYPALAVATQLRDLHNAEILYLGSDDGLENELVPAAGFAMSTVKAGKLPRYLSWQTVKAVSRVPVGMGQALGIVRHFRPQVAFTSGGYVAVPAGLAARFNGAPLLIHQQDVPSNLANRLLTPLATRISVAFAESVRYFPAGKTIHLGNPIRQPILDIRQISVQQARTSLGFAPDLPLLLVTGGSQGARRLNQVIVQALPELLPFCQVLQISGKKLHAETQQQASEILPGIDESIHTRYRLVPYMSDEMPAAMQAAELVICRAGASTLSELATLAKPSILVPLPAGIGGSPQEVNATTFATKQAAEVVQNADLEPAMLIDRLKNIITSPARLQTMIDAVSGFARVEATQEIVATILSMARNSSGSVSKETSKAR